MRSIRLAVIMLALGCATATTQPPVAAPAVTPGPERELNAIGWVRTSAEYRASATQAYELARLRLDQALADPSWTAALEQTGSFSSLPPAVIVDVDETVLDNSAFEVMLLERGKTSDGAMWTQWVSEERATAVPGALDFVKYAESRGVRVFYVTNRTADLEAHTRNNLVKQGFPVAEGAVLTKGARKEWDTSEKGFRRSWVAERYRILLLIGDDFGDFAPGVRVSPAERRGIMERNASAWGRRWIILPNPLYGSWADSLFGFQHGLSEAEKTRRMREGVKLD